MADPYMKAIKSGSGMSLTADEKQSLQGLKGDDRARMEAQIKMQKRSEQVAFVSNILKMKHDSQMAIANNMKS